MERFAASCTTTVDHLGIGTFRVLGDFRCAPYASRNPHRHAGARAGSRDRERRKPIGDLPT